MATLTTEAEHPLRLARWERNLTQEQLAKMAGVATATVHRIETGAEFHSTKAVRALGAALDCDWTELCADQQAVTARCRGAVAA